MYNMNEIVSELAELESKYKPVEKRIKELKNIVLDFAKDSPFFETDNYNVTIKTTISYGLDQKKLKTDFPDIVNEYPLEIVKHFITPTLKAKQEKTA